MELFFSVNYEIAAISISTLEIKEPVNGLIIRNETPVKSPGTRILIPSIQYGEKVKGNEIVSFIKSDMKDIVKLQADGGRNFKRVVSNLTVQQVERHVWENALKPQIAKLTEISDTGIYPTPTLSGIRIDKILEAKARYMLEDRTIMLKMGKEKRSWTDSEAVFKNL